MESSDEILSTPQCGICMKEFSTFITKFDPLNSASLLLVNSLLPKKAKQLVFQDMLEIPFLNCKIPMKLHKLNEPEN